MTNANISASMPVESESLQAELQAAFARIAGVPAGRTLIDDLSTQQWLEDVNHNVAVGSTEHSDEELDAADDEVREIA